MHEVRAWKCDYCKKHYLHKSSAVAHEKKCFYNPHNKACITCGHFQQCQETVYVTPLGGHNYGEDDYEKIYYWCDLNSDEEIKYTHDCKNWIPKEEKENE